MTTVWTPFILQWLAPAEVDWNQLSAISQTYSAVAIPISGAALLGVIYSIGYQIRQQRGDRENAFRSAQRDLLQRAIDDALFMVCWAPPEVPVTWKRHRQHVYINTILTSWHAEFRTGQLNATHVVFTATLSMRGEVFREFWTVYRLQWREAAHSLGAASIIFVDCIDKAYEQAQESGPPIPADSFFIAER
ncbi:DUF6082 family protein [Streptomyces sp. NBC_01518]|uniref:DUF6082 family protein n=1 Tax=Streptomyces sp. NBC_01518 TaxID=2903891 RepID=UPI0038638CC2